MTVQRHVLTTLTAEELPGFIACAGLALADLRKRGFDGTAIVERMQELREIAEGLLANAGAEADQGATYRLSSQPEEEACDDLTELLLSDVEFYEPAEIVKQKGEAISVFWVVRFRISEDGDWDSDIFATRQDAQRFCDSARADAPADDRADDPIMAEMRELAEEIRATLAEPPVDQAPATRVTPSGAAIIARNATPLPPQDHQAPHSVWTEERLALLDANYGTMPNRALLARINALPGHPCGSDKALQVKFSHRKAAGLVKRPEPAPAPAPSTIPEEDKPEARQMVLAGAGAKDLVEEFGWNLAEAQAFARDVRAEQAGEASHG